MFQSLTQVTVREHEGFGSALPRFKLEVIKVGIFNELSHIRHHETPVKEDKHNQGLQNSVSQQSH